MKGSENAKVFFDTLAPVDNVLSIATLRHPNLDNFCAVPDSLLDTSRMSVHFPSHMYAGRQIVEVHRRRSRRVYPYHVV